MKTYWIVVYRFTRGIILSLCIIIFLLLFRLYQHITGDRYLCHFFFHRNDNEDFLFLTKKYFQANFRTNLISIAFMMKCTNK